ncbi:MAG TPA: dUTP diphosphatase, partial [Bacillaceae bacterium]|nr:dUTP diphosphatase [Bacillaceae bacterium]
IAQMLFVPVLRPELRLVEELPESERGDRGFGSTGI